MLIPWKWTEISVVIFNLFNRKFLHWKLKKVFSKCLVEWWKVEFDKIKPIFYHACVSTKTNAQKLFSIGNEEKIIIFLCLWLSSSQVFLYYFRYGVINFTWNNFLYVIGGPSAANPNFTHSHKLFSQFTLSRKFFWKFTQTRFYGKSEKFRKNRENGLTYSRKKNRADSCNLSDAPAGRQG